MSVWNPIYKRIAFVQRLRPGLIEGFVLLALGCIGLIERMTTGSQIKNRGYSEPLTADMFLVVICIAMIIGGIAWGIVTGRDSKEGKEVRLLSPTFLKGMLTIFIYLFLMPWVGFFFSTIIFLFFLFRFCAHLKWLRSLILSTVLSSFFYIIFSWLLDTSLP